MTTRARKPWQIEAEAFAVKYARRVTRRDPPGPHRLVERLMLRDFGKKCFLAGARAVERDLARNGGLPL